MPTNLPQFQRKLGVAYQPWSREKECPMPMSLFLWLTLVLTFMVAPAAHAADAIKASSQPVVDNKVKVRVNTSEDALVVIHPVKAGGALHDPDMSIALGHAPVKTGERSVEVTLEQPVSVGTRLVAVLYADKAEKGRFDPGTDTPVEANGNLVSNGFDVE
jgi:hypothetical protein